MTVDPFAAAQAAESAGTAATAVTEDPFSSAHDMEDPFATGSDFKGGPFTPSPQIETLRNRLIVMIPREFNPEAENPFWEKEGDSKTRELYTVDLYVLGGGPFVFSYKTKADPEKGIAAEYKDYDAGTPSAETPFEVKRFWVPQGGLIGKLKQTHAKGAPLLGVPNFVPRKSGRDKGVTNAAIRAEYDAWVKRGKPGNGPSTAWGIDDPTPEQRKVAITWWAANKGDIEAINVSTAPKR